MSRPREAHDRYHRLGNTALVFIASHDALNKASFSSENTYIYFQRGSRSPTMTFNNVISVHQTRRQASFRLGVGSPRLQETGVLSIPPYSHHS